MITIENTEVLGWEHAVRGMRNPMNSWEKSDTKMCPIYDKEGYTKLYKPNDHPGSRCAGCKFEDVPGGCIIVGENDHRLMMSLAKGGPVHAKYRRMITVYLDITAPLYWWKEFDTYKVGTVANSCSTMHKIHAKEFTLDDFSHEHLFPEVLDAFEATIIKALNVARDEFLKTNDKQYWWQMVQLLPTSYNQKRTIMLSYEVLHNIYHSRRHHKLDEWHTFCNWVEKLPYSEIIIGEKESNHD